MPDIEVTKDIAADARVRIEMRREFFNAMVEHGARVADWREAFMHGHAKATGVEQYMRLIVNVVETPGGARPHPEGAALSTPAADGFRMPAEWAPHERTLMGWPCRRELWGDQLGHAKADYAATANAVAAFEPLTMVVRRRAGRRRGARGADRRRRGRRAGHRRLLAARQRADLRARRRGAAAPACTSASTRGARSSRPTTATPRSAASSIDRLGDRRYEAPFVLEGGSVAVDGEGTLLTTEQCLLHPNRNPAMSREEIEQGLRDFLGVEHVVWLGQGLAEDKDTDGHVDLVAAFTRPGEVLLQSTPPGTPSSERMADNRARLIAAGLEVVDFPILPDAGGRRRAGRRGAYLNFYLCNGAAIVPVAGRRADAEALERIGAAYPDREVVGVPGGVIAFGGGGPHCITQQVPAARAFSTDAGRLRSAPAPR